MERIFAKPLLCAAAALALLAADGSAANTGSNGKDAPVPAADAPALPTPGKVAEMAVDTRMFKKPKEYFAKPIPQKVYRGFKAKVYPASWAEENKLTPDECADYKDVPTAVVYVPAGYDGSEAYGVYVHINSSAGGLHPSKEWQAVCDKLKLIFISPNKTPNSVSMLRRVVLGLDCLATIRAKYKTDPARIYVGGYSGGGHMAMLSQMMYPEIYQGAVSHAAQSYLMDHFPGLSISDARTPPRTKRRWVVISGDKDKNYAEVQKSSKDWERLRALPYRFIDSPGMGHQNAPAEAFEEALIWIGAGLTPQDKAAAGAKPGAARKNK